MMKRFDPSPAAGGAAALLLGLLLGTALTWTPGKSPRKLRLTADAHAPRPDTTALRKEEPPPSPETPVTEKEDGRLKGFRRLEEMPDALRRLRKQGVPDALARRILLESMMRSIEAGEYGDAAFTAAWERTGTDGRSLISSVRLEALATLRPEEFLKAATGGGMVLAADVASALGGLAGSSPQAAAKLLTELRKAGVAVSGGPLFEAWGKGDPDAALKACGAMALESEKDAALTAVYKGWMLKDLRGALADWKRRGAGESGLRFGDDRKEWMSELFFHAAKDAAGSRAALDLISAAGEQDRASLNDAAFAAMGARDPAGAVEMWRKAAAGGWGKSDAGSPGSAAIAGLLEGLAWDSPERAREFLTGAESRELLRAQGPGGFPFMFEGVADLIAGAGPEKAAAWANDLQRAANHEQPETYISIALAKLAARHAEGGAAALLAGVENDWVRARAAAELVDETAGDGGDPAALLDLIRRPEDRNEAAGRYVGSLVVSDFAAAAEWAATHDSHYPGAVKALVDGWAMFDVAGAAEMVAALPPGERRDLIPDLAVGLTTTMPGVAMAWAAGMEEGEARAAALEAVAERAALKRIPVDVLLAERSLSSEDKQLISRAWMEAANTKP